MAVAGKVAITLSTENGGAWSADVTYDRLVAVKHNNNLYISRKTVANVEPPNDEFWFLALEGFGGDDVQALIDRMNELSGLIQAIIDGTTQVGNAKTLDGHEAEYFAPLSLLTAQKQPTGANLNDYDELGTYYFDGYATDYVNTPNSTAHNGILVVRRYSSTRATQEYISINTGKIYTRTGGSGSWNAWKEVFTTAGGTITTDSNSRLPQLPLELVNGVDENGSVIRFADQKGALGHLGFVEKNKPVFSDVNGVVKDLLHTGNKPTGTYTGNGSAEQRTINVGGIGSMLILTNSSGTFFIDVSGCKGIGGDGKFVILSSNYVTYGNGVLTLKTDNAYINGSGKVTTYHSV